MKTGGIQGSLAQHTKVKQYYAAVNSSPDSTLDDKTMAHQLADRQRAIKDPKKLTTTAKLLTRSNQKMLTRLKLAEKKIKSQDLEIKIWKKKYLIDKRKLPSALVDSLHNSGLIYANKKQNAVFLRRSMDEEKITGANLRGTAGTDNKFKVLKH